MRVARARGQGSQRAEYRDTSIQPKGKGKDKEGCVHCVRARYTAPGREGEKKKEGEKRGRRSKKKGNGKPDAPSPIKMTGDPVAATAERAPPPFAWPSSLVMMTAPTSTFSLKAFAWPSQAWPMDASITNTIWFGSTALATSSLQGTPLRKCKRERTRLACCHHHFGAHRRHLDTFDIVNTR